MDPKAVVESWVESFNRGDADGLAALYSEHAVNHQLPETRVEGREAIRAMFVDEFDTADMKCIVENLFVDGEWAVLEWRDPLGLRGMRCVPRAERANPLSTRLLRQALVPAAAWSPAAGRGTIDRKRVPLIAPGDWHHPLDPNESRRGLARTSPFAAPHPFPESRSVRSC